VQRHHLGRRQVGARLGRQVQAVRAQLRQDQLLGDLRPVDQAPGVDFMNLLRP
jgi:hypothetical protein